ncbi:SSI family serine proteinase inhibitor [Streptomyces brasiliensis]|uniref:Subtilisin inhibitor domain-containing protein n=1 Tax=Streptomyces brasiliensis TaxID=1954 RepID=A0A917KJH4_9ACTN|nr:SSI family serine proteinase inhibitor [Streptomyces brasiliensis]GGJ14217.1 hypothetical protein GCM10010121_026030 [Streptomyces brasiliensis]
MSPIISRAAAAAASVTAAAALAAAVTTAPASAVTPVTPAPWGSPGTGDHLTVTVRHAGAGRDGTYALSCHPGSGSHPDVAGACSVVDQNTRWGREPFAPVPEGSACTLQYGGPAITRVTGSWAGRPVDATYDRGDGCEIARWNRMVPLLPDLSHQSGLGR